VTRAEPNEAQAAAYAAEKRRAVRCGKRPVLRAVAAVWKIFPDVRRLPQNAHHVECAENKVVRAQRAREGGVR